MIADFGRYLGRAELTAPVAVLGRRVDNLLETGLAVRVSGSLVPCSSGEDAPLKRPDCLLVLRVMVLFVGDPSSLLHVEFGDFDGALAAAWEPAVLLFMRAIVLRRREDSFDFLDAFWSRSRGSLLITSANAFPTEVKFNDCRREARVVGFEGREGFEVVSGNMRTSRRVPGVWCMIDSD